jgi:hypothetical protein
MSETSPASTTPEITHSRLPGVLLAAGLVLFLAATVALTALVPPPIVSAPVLGPDRPDAGGAVCAAGTSGDLTSTAYVIAAVSDDTAGDDGGADGEADGEAEVLARTSVLVLGAEPQRLALDALPPSEPVLVAPSLGADGWLWSGWADRPTVTWREWNSTGGPGLPRGRSAAPCVATSAATYVIPGLRTDAGNEAYLTLANPFTSDATFAVTFVTPGDRVQPIALRNVSVSHGQRVQLRVNDHLPREADVAAIVTVGAGRLAVEAHQLALAGIGGIDGLTLVQASTEPSTSWTVPWLISDDERSTWLSILNPESRSVTLDVVVHTASGSTLPDGFESIVVPPFGLVRVTGAELALRPGEPFGVTVSSETTGVHVAAGLEVRGETVEMTGIATFLGSPSGDERWVLAGLGAPERATTLHVVNLGEQAADVTLDLRVREGEATSSSRRPLATLVVAPGAVVRVTLPLPEDGIWSLEVAGPPQIVVARTAFGSTSLEPVVTPAVPASVWRRPVGALAGRSLDSWGRALGTVADRRSARDPIGTLPPFDPPDGG